MKTGHPGLDPGSIPNLEFSKLTDRDWLIRKAALTQVGRLFTWQLESESEQGHNQQCHNVDDLDQRIDGRAGGVFVGVTYRVAGDCSRVGIGALTARVLAIWL